MRLIKQEDLGASGQFYGATPRILDGSFMMEWNNSAMSSSFSSYAVGFVMKLGGERSGVALSCGR